MNRPHRFQSFAARLRGKLPALLPALFLLAGASAVLRAATYAPTIFTRPPVSGAGVNTPHGVITARPGGGQVSLRSRVVASNYSAGSCRAGILNLVDGNFDPVVDDGILSQAKLDSLVGRPFAAGKATVIL